MSNVFLCIAAVSFIPVSIAIIASSAVKAMSVNPEAKSVNTLAIFGMALCESIAIFAIVYLSFLK